MDWLINLFTNTESIAHIALLYALVIAVGVYLGKIKVGGISLGVTFVLFAGSGLSITMHIELFGTYLLINGITDLFFGVHSHDEALELKGAFSGEGATLSETDVKALANLPSKDQLIGQVVDMLLSPVNDITNGLSGNLHALLDGIADKATN